MEKSVQERALELVLKEYLEEGNTDVVKEIVKETGRKLTEEETHQLFEKALSRGAIGRAMRIAKFRPLNEVEKDKLISVCWRNWSHLPEALKITGRKISEKDFHRLIKRAIKNWGWDTQNLIIELSKQTGFKLTDQEKKEFLELMVKIQRKNDGYDGFRLFEGLQFLGKWLPPEGAERLFTVVESYRWPDICFDSLMKLAILARGRVNKDRIINKASLAIDKWKLEKLEEIVKQATGESLVLDDYHYLFKVAMEKEAYSPAVEIATQKPEAIKEQEFSDLITKLVSTYFSFGTGISVAKAATQVGKLNGEVLKSLLCRAAEMSFFGDEIFSKIDLYALALERGVDPRKFKPVKEDEPKPKKRSWLFKR